LNSFARRGDISGQMFFRTMTGISSGPVAFVESRFLMRVAMSFTVTVILLRRLSVREGKSGRGWPRSSRVELEAKFEAKRFALSIEEERTSGPFIMVGIVAFPLLRTLFVIRQNSREPTL